MNTVIITSGNGPLEASLAAQYVYETLTAEIEDLVLPGTEQRYTNENSVDNLPRSIVFDTKVNPTKIDQGTWRVVFKSPYRPSCKRKNWYVKVSVITTNEIETAAIFDKTIKIVAFRCGGNGGQNVNKVSTGVRITYHDIEVESTELRSQYLNRQRAFEKLYKKLNDNKAELIRRQENLFWHEKLDVERGNEVRKLDLSTLHNKGWSSEE